MGLKFREKGEMKLRRPDGSWKKLNRWAKAPLLHLFLGTVGAWVWFGVSYSSRLGPGERQLSFYKKEIFYVPDGDLLWHLTSQSCVGFRDHIMLWFRF